MSDETVDQSTVQHAGDDDPRIAVLQAVFDRVDSWQEGADEETVRKELDEAVAKSDIELDEATRERIVRHVVDDTSHGDVRELLG
jgi:hypothetical protein